MLYLLSIAFPFFAIFLVMPGRATSFFVWCSLWVWVKSWDIGFALVHVARDVLWHIFKHRVNMYKWDIDWSDPMSILAVIYNNDPIMNQNTYWEITSMLTVLVPLLTAHLCLGATGVYDMFKNSIDQVANRFGRVEAAASRRYVGNMIDDAQKRQQFRYALARTLDSMDNGENGANPTRSPQNPDGQSTVLGEKLPGFDTMGVNKNVIGSGALSDFKSAAQIQEAQAEFMYAGFTLRSTTQAWQDKTEMERMQAKEGGVPHYREGMMSDQAKVSDSALNILYGSNWQSKRGITWGEAAVEQKEIAFGYAEFKSGMVNRRSDPPLTQSHKGYADFASVRQQVAKTNRALSSGADISYAPGWGRQILGFWQRPEEVGNPSIESDKLPSGLPLGKGDKAE
jgi:hypothetical protein